MARSRDKVRRTPPERERGASLVEFALLVPILFAILLGIFSGGAAYNTKLAITSAAREGARYGGTLPANQPLVAGATWASTVQQMVYNRSQGELSSTQGTVCVALVEGSPGAVISEAPPGSTAGSPSATTYYSTSGTACIPNDSFPVSSADPGRRVQVTVSKGSSIQALIYNTNLTLTSRAVARAESNL